MDLERCTASEKTEGEIEKYRRRYENGAIEMTKKQQSTFFPMAEDDYFMTVAILSGKLSEKDNEVSTVKWYQRIKRGLAIQIISMFELLLVYWNMHSYS